MNFSKIVKSSILGLFLGLLAINAQAQNKTVTGKVLDAKDGSPIAAASVVAKGTSTGAKTAADGTFAITVPSSVTKLVVSTVGYSSREVSAEGNVTVSLNQTSEQLNEVVVVGYGTRKIKDATGAVASLGEKSFNKGIISSPEQLLQGRVAGVNVTTNSGEPGGAVNVTIRGTSSVRSNNNPLYVVDGVPLYGGGTVGSAISVEGGTTARNPLSFLNPNDIENISILKDASSAAIYGARGANGVVLITTKSGKGKPSLTFNATTSVSTTAKRYDLAGPQNFMYGIKKTLDESGFDFSGVGSNDKGFNTDWQDQVFQTAISNSYNLSWGFSNSKSSLKLNGSYDNQEGIVKTQGLKRYTFGLKYSNQLTSRLKLDVTANQSIVNNKYAQITNNAGYQGSLIGAMISANPTFPVYNANGTWFDNQDGNRNPVAILEGYNDSDTYNKLLANVSVSYKITDDLTYKAIFGMENGASERLTFVDPRLPGNYIQGPINVRGKNYIGSDFAGKGRAAQQFLDQNSTLIEHTLNYDKTFKNGNNLQALAAFSYQKTTDYYRASQRWGNAGATRMLTDYKQYTGGVTDVYGDSTQVELQSYFSRVNYTMKDKYILSALVRIDGSSKFSDGNKYGTFPAFGFKWRMLEEKFAQNTLGKIFSNFDIRLNYGITGNQEFPAYASLALQQRNFVGGNSVITNSNPNLRWEQTTTTGAGIDFTMFNGRLNGTVDYFNKSTQGLLFLISYPQPAASADRWVNLDGDVINKGWEFSLDYQLVRPAYRGAFGWDVNYNMSFLKNTTQGFGSTVVNTGEVSGQGLTGAFAQTIRDGYPLFTFVMPTFLRFDAFGNGVYANGAKDEIQGSALPTFNAGLTNNFTYKKFTASFFFNAVTGFYVYNNTANALLLKGSLKNARNVTNDVVNSIENSINPGNVSTRFLEKGDYIRFANASLNYAVDVKPGSFIKGLNISLSGQNLGLFTKYTGLDPEVNVDKSRNGVPSRGFDYTATPRARVITLGINARF
jgi:TonB-linked SusC/RagA family outer membrane protein